LIEKLGSKGACPHGNQIDKSAGERRRLGLRQLWDATPGSSVRIDSVYERDRRLLEYFDSLGIRPGVELKVVNHNYDGTVALQLKKTPLIIGESAASKIWVSEIPH
jgi:Fe2+ transport system protein FeoA